MWRSRHGSDPKPHSPLFRSRCGSGGRDICGVDKPSVQIHQPLRLQSDLQPLQDAVEGALVRPDAVPVVRALPGTVSLRKVSPRSTTARNPDDGVEHLPRVTPLASGGLRRREKIANELPLPLVEFVPFYHKGSIAAERLVGVLRQALVSLPLRCRVMYDEVALVRWEAAEASFSAGGVGRNWYDEGRPIGRRVAAFAVVLNHDKDS